MSDRFDPFDMDETLALLAELVRIQSPYFEEARVMAYTDGWCRANGLDSYIFEYAEDDITHFHGQNVIVPLKGNRPGVKLCVNGHLDTVRLCSGWTRAPWGERDGDRFYGVGALDMTAGAAAELIALKAFKELHGDHFAGEIIGAFVSCEEGPYGLGTNALIESGLLDGVDASVCCEPSAAFTGSAFPTVCLGARGGYGLSIELEGVSAHASRPELGINAVEDAAAVVGEIKNIVCASDPELGRGVYCVLGIESDPGACSVPDHAAIRLFRHTVRGEDKASVTRELERAIERASIRSRAKVCFREAPNEGADGFLPYTIDRENPYTELFLKSVESACGKAPAIVYFSSIGDFNYLGTRLNGAPVYLFGPAGAGFHGGDEYVEISSVLPVARALLSFFERMLLR